MYPNCYFPFPPYRTQLGEMGRYRTKLLFPFNFNSITQFGQLLCYITVSVCIRHFRGSQRNKCPRSSAYVFGCKCSRKRGKSPAIDWIVYFYNIVIFVQLRPGSEETAQHVYLLTNHIYCCVCLCVMWLGSNPKTLFFVQIQATTVTRRKLPTVWALRLAIALGKTGYPIEAGYLCWSVGFCQYFLPNASHTNMPNLKYILQYHSQLSSYAMLSWCSGNEVGSMTF